MQIKLKAPIDCIGDFTYNFYWQQQGRELAPDDIIPHQQNTNYTYRDIVDALKSGEDLYIKGNVGHRLGSSLGVDLKYFSGSGKALKVETERLGNIFVDGDVDTRMGISQVSSTIYVKGTVKSPIGNVVEVQSDLEGYKKFRSITDILHNGLGNDILLPPNYFDNKNLVIKDKIKRDTIGARCDCNKNIIVMGDVALSNGILMKKGCLYIKGNAGMNTGVLLNGGTVIVDGNVEEFAGTKMREGILIIKGRVKGYLGANMKGGVIFAKNAKPLPQVKQTNLNSNEITMLRKYLKITQIEAMMYKKISRYYHK